MKGVKCKYQEVVILALNVELKGQCGMFFSTTEDGPNLNPSWLWTTHRFIV